jgi:hypothetical protein
VTRQAYAASWKTLAVERIKDVSPTIPLGRRFWPLSKEEKQEIGKVLLREEMRKLATMPPGWSSSTPPIG